MVTFDNLFMLLWRKPFNFEILNNHAGSSIILTTCPLSYSQLAQQCFNTTDFIIKIMFVKLTFILQYGRFPSLFSCYVL